MFNIFFSNNTIFIFSNIEYLADLKKKITAINISFDYKYLLNFHVSVPYVAELLTIELYICNFLSICLFHNTPFIIDVIALPLLILFSMSFSYLSSTSILPHT